MKQKINLGLTKLIAECGIRLLTDVNIHGGRRWSSSLHRNNKPRIISNITNSLLKTLKRMEDAPSVTPFMRKSLRAINVTQLKLENNRASANPALDLKISHKILRLTVTTIGALQSPHLL
ncbi:uncharacterized protein [Physcomitrium patens]|uniref:uncharacterized protein isoform X3 n=1 Tax=Physcomitrium patens TaxID=3218 RepID=UPI003CCDB7D5